jgi:hypothetical protein
VLRAVVLPDCVSIHAHDSSCDIAARHGHGAFERQFSQPCIRQRSAAARGMATGRLCRYAVPVALLRVTGERAQQQRCGQRCRGK